MSKTNSSTDNHIRKSVDIYIVLALVTFLGYVSYTLVSPFVSILLWAAVLAVALYPLFLKLASLFGGRKKTASILIALLSLVLLLAPVTWLAQSALDSASNLMQEVENGTFSVPEPNPSIKEWPLIGEKAFKVQSDAHANIQTFMSERSEQIKSLAGKVVGMSASLLIGTAQFVLSIIFASVFLIYAAPLGNMLKTLARRINPANGDRFVDIAAMTTRNVSKAVVGIALIQGILGSIGFVVAGLPFAGLWCALLFGTALVSLPILVIIPAIIYMWSVASTTAALIFTIYMIPIMLIDNILRPIIAAKGLATPMSIIFLGVIGGAMSLGLIGLFVGPVILAVFHEMIGLWTKESKA